MSILNSKPRGFSILKNMKRAMSKYFTYRGIACHDLSGINGEFHVAKKSNYKHMKFRQYYITVLLVVSALFIGGCSDEYLENLNTDPSKASTIDPNAQLTTAQLQTYGDLGMVEIYRNYLFAFNQHLMGAWNTTNYGGRHTVDNNEMSRIWTSFYTNAIKNLTDGLVRTADAPDKVNIHSALRIYRVYMMSLITDIYGDAPYSEAGMGYLGSKFNPRYDTQEEIYNDFFTELTAAVDAFDSSKDRITGDVIFNGNLDKWKKTGQLAPPALCHAHLRCGTRKSAG
jgi:hypothetical protein